MMTVLLVGAFWVSLSFLLLNILLYFHSAYVAINDNDEGRRPDYVVDIFKGYTREFTRCIGEIKWPQASDRSKMVDFYRLDATWYVAILTKHIFTSLYLWLSGIIKLNTDWYYDSIRRTFFHEYTLCVRLLSVTTIYLTIHL